MKLKSVEIDNYRAIEHLHLPLDPSLTVLHGGNTCGKTSVLSAIAVGLGVIPRCLPGVSGIRLGKIDRRTGSPAVRVSLTATDGVAWECKRFAGKRRQDDIGSLNEMMEYCSCRWHGRADGIAHRRLLRHGSVHCGQG